MRPSGRLAVLTLVCLTPLPLFADEARQHDGGFFMRFSPAFGASSTKIEDAFGQAELSGPAGAFEVALGYGVSRNFIVHANLGAWSMVDPKLDLDGTEFPTDDLTMTLTCFGAGVTYYVGNSNIYLTASLGLANLTASLDDESANTDMGFAVEAAVGKEWWIARHWGLGVGGVVNYHSVPDADIDEKWSGTSFGIRLTLTMN